jgi:geranylgeranyl diphosphate synthase type I
LTAQVDQRIGTFLRQRRDAIPEASTLIDEIERVVGAGGKRLRPAFCYWGYRATGGTQEEEILRLTTAFELLHTFAIVHDDIMDRSFERRGQPTTFATMGTDRALLVGDLALVLADAAFWASGFTPDQLCSAFAEFTTMREQVIAGQHMDLEAHGRPIAESEARAIAIMKSGSYSIEHPLLIGARLAEADDSVIEGLRAFGRPLGEAFQLVDDVLGVFGDPAVTGKPSDSDIREGKHNVLFAKTVEALTGAERDYFVTNWGLGDALDERDVDRLRELVGSSGARKATEELIDSLAEDASNALDRLAVNDDGRLALGLLMDAAIRRSR